MLFQKDKSVNSSTTNWKFFVSAAFLLPTLNLSHHFYPKIFAVADYFQLLSALFSAQFNQNAVDYFAFWTCTATSSNCILHSLVSYRFVFYIYLSMIVLVFSFSSFLRSLYQLVSGPFIHNLWTNKPYVVMYTTTDANFGAKDKTKAQL